MPQQSLSVLEAFVIARQAERQDAERVALASSPEQAAPRLAPCHSAAIVLFTRTLIEDSFLLPLCREFLLIATTSPFSMSLINLS